MNKKKKKKKTVITEEMLKLAKKKLEKQETKHNIACSPGHSGHKSISSQTKFEKFEAKNIKIMMVRVFGIVWYTFLWEGASPAVRGKVVNA